MKRIAPSSKRSEHIFIAGDSLMSLVFALKAKPKIVNFFDLLFEAPFDYFFVDSIFLPFINFDYLTPIFGNLI